MPRQETEQPNNK